MKIEVTNLLKVESPIYYIENYYGRVRVILKNNKFVYCFKARIQTNPFGIRELKSVDFGKKGVDVPFLPVYNEVKRVLLKS